MLILQDVRELTPQLVFDIKLLAGVARVESLLVVPEKNVIGNPRVAEDASVLVTLLAHVVSCRVHVVMAGLGLASRGGAQVL